jgi:hypothetical protein
LGKAGGVCPLWRRSMPRPNKRFQLTPLRGERDRAVFVIWNWPDCFPDLSRRRS